MQYQQQLQDYKTASQSALAVARQFTDYLDRVTLYKGITDNSSLDYRQSAHILQKICMRMEQHIREHLNAFTLRRIGNKQAVGQLPAMLILEKEMVPQLLESEKQLAQAIDNFMLYLCEGMGENKLHDIRFLRDTLRLRRRLCGNPPEDILMQIEQIVAVTPCYN